MRQIFFGIALAALPLPALAQGNFSSPAQVVDGDSLSVSGMSIRLFGIDAPEMQQDCKRNGEAWKCGEEAKRQLQTLVADSRVECRGKGMDEYGRTVAVCIAGNLELNKTMVEQGWATAFRKYSDAYVAEETRAKSAGLGIWASEFVLPEDYRNTHRSPGPEQGQSSWAPRPVRQSRAATSGCAIKGNRSRKGEPIYHLPGMPYYDTTVPEQTFCSETEAQAAGYRRSRARW